MKSATAPARSKQIDYVSSELLPGAALLTRLLVRELGGELSRTEVGLLGTLGDGPRRITELAELEGLAQPTMTILIKQLEQKGLVPRTRQSGDGRVVLVDLTESGSVALADYRGRLRAVLGEYLAEISDEQVEALAAATETLAQLDRPPAATTRREEPDVTRDAGRLAALEARDPAGVSQERSVCRWNGCGLELGGDSPTAEEGERGENAGGGDERAGEERRLEALGQARPAGRRAAFAARKSFVRVTETVATIATPERRADLERRVARGRRRARPRGRGRRRAPRSRR